MQGLSASEPVEPGIGTPEGFASGFAQVDLPANVVPIRRWQVPAPRVPEAAQFPLNASEHAARATPLFGAPSVRLPQWPLVLVLTGVLMSVLLVVVDSFRLATFVLAGSVVMCFFLRLVLTEQEAGWLKVRSRSVDLVVLGVLAAALVMSAFWVPAAG
ncbi:MAG: DUF3017 domain-containing protein [Actinomycetes bacterium]